MGLSRLKKLQFKNILKSLSHIFIGIVPLFIGISIASIFVKIGGINLNDAYIIGNIVFWMTSLFVFFIAIDTTSSVKLYINTGITRKSIFISNIINMIVMSIMLSVVVTLVARFIIVENKVEFYKYFNLSDGIDIFWKSALLFLVIHSIAILWGYAFKISVRTGVLISILCLIIISIVIFNANSIYIYVFKNIPYFLIGLLLLTSSLIASKVMLNRI
ncbi:hypothetical protein [Miniphocaeibacter massiliensis]|uniref:hypothetical protein n=1 Tax=Miniphocaeibacter massiliensis TaxID=2041841 RepID=UPI000C1C3945|nr:hypothetical protein [Miniphocaeibacter massiliensis]